MSDRNTSPPSDTLITHLLELRDRLLRCVVAVLVVFLIAAFFANDIYEIFAAPLMQALPEGNTMISTEPHGPFFVPFKLAFAVSIALVIPYLLYQLWAFVAPGLYENEKRLVMPLLVSSSTLFFTGIAFAYFVVFPIIFKFFAGTAPEGVAVMTDINAYMSFALKLFFAFGVAFEVPIATMLLIKSGISTPDSLAAKRPYIIVGAFVVGMLMTPPDMFSQAMLAIPVWLLFELGLWLSRKFIVDKETPGDSEEDDVELMDDDAMEQELARGEDEFDTLDKNA